MAIRAQGTYASSMPGPWRSLPILAALIGAACGAQKTAPLPKNEVGPAGDRPSRPPPGEMVVYAMFKDAAGLPVGSRVVLAGIEVGRISAVAIEQHPRCGRCARVEMIVRADLGLPVSTAVIKRASATVGELYLEIDPGPAPATNLEPGQLHHGDEIEQVIEQPGSLEPLNP